MSADRVGLADLEVVVSGGSGVEDELPDRVGIVDRSDPAGGPAVGQVNLGEWLDVEVVEPELWCSLGCYRLGLALIVDSDGDHVPGPDKRGHCCHSGYVRVDHLQEVVGNREAVDAIALADRSADYQVQIAGDVDGQFVERVTDPVGEKERRGHEGHAEDHRQGG